MTGTVTDALRVARTELGVVEKPTNVVPYWPGIGLPQLQGAAWCGAFVWWVLAQAGVTGLPSTPRRFVYTPAGLADFAKAGRLVSAPRPGDIVWFNFDTEPGPEHVGLIVEVTGSGGLVTIEGNTSPDNQGSQANGGGVYERHRSRALVCGIGRPPYTTPPTTVDNAGVTTTPRLTRLLQLAKPMMHGDDVRRVQGRLAFTGRDADGVYGPRTAAAVEALQRRKGLHVDGVVGPATARALGMVWAGGPVRA